MMLTRKVIATNVTNLTDARYFAARGIDFILLDLGSINIDTVAEIKEWIEGPQILLLVDHAALSTIDEAIIRIAPYAMSAASPDVLAEMQYLQGHITFFSWSLTSIHLEGIAYVPFESAKGLEDIDSSHGLILSGGDEDAVGVKDFDHLDELLEALESPSW